MVERRDIVNALVGGAAVLRTVDPYAKYACPAKEFVEKHGGEINVESQVSAGTTFSFTVPSSSHS